ncbi:EF-P lysine aminoacylase EpmA [Methylophaga lonarensis]|uniref:EF-P lysine aminoacylase EpmA n=1 Tax=Methylophaga lonarensis TaxID=999151 RepID=UPI003D2B3693
MAATELMQNKLKRRAQLMADVRHFFAERAVLEVDTPMLSSAAPTATYLDSFATHCDAGEKAHRRYLHTSPEFAMKRLLAAGSGPIYQICHVFRNGELGRLHSPEFTMLEWYRPGFTLLMLMQELDQLLQKLTDFAPAVYFSYAQVFNDYLQIDCLQADETELRMLALDKIPALPASWQTDRDGWLELLMTQCIEPQLAQLSAPVMIYDFPASQAQLARCVEDAQGNKVAARFELYAGGLELANGYDELTDAIELHKRFVDDNRVRKSLGKAEMPIDQHLLMAQSQGLPQCSGVALGLDRLLMLLLDTQEIAAVQSIGFSDN